MSFVLQALPGGALGGAPVGVDLSVTKGADGILLPAWVRDMADFYSSAGQGDGQQDIDQSKVVSTFVTTILQGFTSGSTGIVTFGGAVFLFVLVHYSTVSCFMYHPSLGLPPVSVEGLKKGTSLDTVLHQQPLLTVLLVRSCLAHLKTEQMDQVVHWF